MFNLFATLFSINEHFTCEHGKQWMAIDVVKVDAKGYFILAVPLNQPCPLTPQVVYTTTESLAKRGLTTTNTAEPAVNDNGSNPDGGGLGHP